MSAAITRWKMAGQSSRSAPCSVMSGWTPSGSARSTALMTSTDTPFRRMIAIEQSTRPWVLETSGARFTVQLM
jgi:hypothetical protein